MVDMPLGVYRLDSMLDGGVPTGSVIVLATDPGAGGRKFARTSATMNALATADNELYERYYRRDFDADSVVAPGTVNYVSLSATAESLEATLAETIADDAAASAANGINYRDFSPTYFAESPVPEEWYRGGDTPSALPAEDAAAGAAAGTDAASDTDPDAASDTGVEQVAEFDGVRPPSDTDDAATESETDAADGDPFEYGEDDSADDPTPAERAGLPGADSEPTDDDAAAETAGENPDPDAGDADGAESGDDGDDDDAGGYNPTTDGGTPGGPAGDGNTNASPGAQPILPALQSFLTEHAPGSLTVIDAITDLRPLPDAEAAWPEVTRLLRGLTRAISSWGGVVLVVVDREAVTGTEVGALSAGATGTLEFAWETGGSQRARVMNIRELRGALDRLDRDEIVQFEAEMHDRGYDLSNVRKIR
jgi:hypothetical protein